MSDYRLSAYRDPMNAFLSLPTEAISQLYLTGVGNRSYFDLRSIYYLSFSGNQQQVPVVYPCSITRTCSTIRSSAARSPTRRTSST